MLRYVFVSILAFALVQASPKRSYGSGNGSGSGSGSGSNSQSYDMSPEAVLSAKDFHADLQGVKDTALAMSAAINGVKGLAEKALSDPEGEGWEEFGEAMEKLFEGVDENFGRKMDKVTGLAEALWENNNDLVKDNKCGFVAALDEQKEEIDDVGLAFVFAMIEDLGCMATEFAGAEGIELDRLTDDLHEDEAIEIVMSTVWELKKIGRAGELFGKSLHSVAEFLEGGDDERSLDRLARTLQEFQRSENEGRRGHPTSMPE